VSTPYPLVSQEHGPIPANAIAQLTHGMHFLTDAFASGHMRVPRHQVGPQGSMLSVVMHDFDNSLGLIVENGFPCTQAWSGKHLVPQM
jgi:hypothetical protein